MTTISNILRIGNSCGVIIPAKMLKALALSEKDAVSVSEVGGRILIRKLPSADMASPFRSLDEWYEERGYLTDEPIADSMQYVADIKSHRNNKEIPEW